ncbi:hypothetical protein [Alkalibacterium olivapovliticus]|uniref:Peptidylprolyl isomerase n=1 Tax=Alkalibacterium olivapovliticus TaxID=99907 RepID=A0A2T0W0U5_9LACT|nr:hypothetical protein [Alkalibacterium olivapovliticus]PRY78631.1 hypothetical protein CLV38_1252 [Alkalibacterium olivapovliticus]
MKKQLVVVLFAILYLTSCDSQEYGIEEVDAVNDDIQSMIDPNLTLQLISIDEDYYYVVFHSSLEVEAEVEIQEDTLLIQLTELSDEADLTNQHIFKLTTGQEHDTLEVFINDESTYIDEFIIM